jgi:hypothetical protein
MTTYGPRRFRHAIRDVQLQLLNFHLARDKVTENLPAAKAS